LFIVTNIIIQTAVFKDLRKKISFSQSKVYILLTVVPVLWKGMESEGEGVGGRVLERYGLRRGRGAESSKEGQRGRGLG
jgi:hypothetical protein